MKMADADDTVSVVNTVDYLLYVNAAGDGFSDVDIGQDRVFKVIDKRVIHAARDLVRIELRVIFYRQIIFFSDKFEVINFLAHESRPKLLYVRVAFDNNTVQKRTAFKIGKVCGQFYLIVFFVPRKYIILILKFNL